MIPRTEGTSCVITIDISCSAYLVDESMLDMIELK